MSTPSTSSGNNTTTTLTCTTNSSSQIPVRTYKRKVDKCTMEPKAKVLKLSPIEEISPWEQISDVEIYQAKYVQDIEPLCKQVQDIQMFYKRFQDFHTKMVLMNETTYLCLGLDVTYNRIEKHLAGFLGELHYYREKEHARNKYSSERE